MENIIWSAWPAPFKEVCPFTKPKEDDEMSLSLIENILWMPRDCPLSYPQAGKIDESSAVTQ